MMKSQMMVNIMSMKTINVPIAEARTDLCALVKKVQSGVQIAPISYGQPKAMIVPLRQQGRPWRVEKPDDPKRYGNLQAPVMEPWE